MRLKISASAENACDFPFNYNYILNASIYYLTKKVFSHTIDEDSSESRARVEKLRKCLNMYTFSRLNFSPRKQTDTGFKNVSNIDFIFAAPVELSCQPHIIETFRDERFYVRLKNKKVWFTITNISLFNQPDFESEADFICLSPMTVGVGRRKNIRSNRYTHCLDYMNEPERSLFIRNLHHNLKRKYELLHQKPYKNNVPFEFTFNSDYIEKHNGRISKLIHIKNEIKVKGFEAPFTIKGDPALIEIGYLCGFGEKNNMGFGCAAYIDNRPQDD